ncbi:DNA repair protein RecO [Bifidobacterium sp. DSM 109958]|uniref:DNA repair protein RecO n=1 Tax=Bifidobacterium moraviense TaxID=2675323 RepID=A0A7Y0HYV2_9BIFI|nr:DNA repair protein RecO [Bifidobacterium sp. DSM 109958]NMN00129.1 DNA repair protein RecO [Bifidobacterium sp. DSM 109958]
MPLYRDEGVVLRTAKLGEADRIIWLFTRAHGKVRAVAKGVRRTKSRFGARLEPFMRADVLINTGRSLDVVSQAATIAAYAAPLAADYDSYAAANVIAETADRIVSTEREPAPDQYRMLVAALAALARGAHRPQAVGASYVLRALALAGWRPRLESCVVCGDPAGEDAPDGRSAYFSVPAGGVMCEADHTPESRRLLGGGPDGGGTGAAPGTLRQLRALLDGDWTVLDAAPLAAQSEHIVSDWGAYYLERPIRSLRLLDS